MNLFYFNDDYEQWENENVKKQTRASILWDQLKWCNLQLFVGIGHGPNNTSWGCMTLLLNTIDGPSRIQPENCFPTNKIAPSFDKPVFVNNSGLYVLFAINWKKNIFLQRCKIIIELYWIRTRHKKCLIFFINSMYLDYSANLKQSDIHLLFLLIGVKSPNRKIKSKYINLYKWK